MLLALFIIMLTFLLLIRPVDGFAPALSPYRHALTLLKDQESATEWFSFAMNGDIKDKLLADQDQYVDWMEEEFIRMGEMMAREQQPRTMVKKQVTTAHEPVDWFDFASQEMADKMSKGTVQEIAHDVTTATVQPSDWFGAASEMSPPKSMPVPSALTSTNEVDWFAIASDLSPLNKPTVFLQDDHAAADFLVQKFHAVDAPHHVVDHKEKVDWFSTTAAPKMTRAESPATPSVTNDADWFSFSSSL